jgi:Tfp pilus assembly ATPase PilU
MYRMEDLLVLLTAEQAKELRFRAGHPPVIVAEDEQHPLQGPPLTGEDVGQLLRSVATSRQMRELRMSGAVQFIYVLPDRSPFLIRAKMEDANVVIEVS